MPVYRHCGYTICQLFFFSGHQYLLIQRLPIKKTHTSQKNMPLQSVVAQNLILG